MYFNPFKYGFAEGITHSPKARYFLFILLFFATLIQMNFYITKYFRYMSRTFGITKVYCSTPSVFFS